jgi:hypothetical protein
MSVLDDDGDTEALNRKDNQPLHTGNQGMQALEETCEEPERGKKSVSTNKSR